MGVIMNSGTIKIKLKELLEKKHTSKTKTIYKAEMQATQFNKYYNNKVKSINLNVVARLCSVLECEISDLLEFVPPEK